MSNDYTFVKHLKDENRHLEKENKFLKDIITDILLGDTCKGLTEWLGDEKRAMEIYRFYSEKLKNKYGTYLKK